MPEYFVQITAQYYRGFVVEADNEDEAKEKAQDKFEYECSSYHDSLEMKVEEL